MHNTSHSVFHKTERFYIYLLLISIALCSSLDVKGNGTLRKELDIKTNLLLDAVGTMSLGAEYRFSPSFSVDLMGAWNPWTFSNNMMYRQWSLGPQFRWWPGDKGHFLGLTLEGGEFNFNKVSLPFNSSPSLRDYRYEGWNIGAGLAYGYRYDVSRRFALEVTIGIGVSHVDYDKYLCDRCGEEVATGSRLYVGPMRTGVNLIYRIGATSRRGTGPIEIPMPRPDTIREIVHDTIYIKEYIRDDANESRTGAGDAVRNEHLSVRINYPVSSSKILPDFAGNRVQLETLSEFIDKAMSDHDIKVLSIDFDGYASIEGNSKSNQSLSRRRAEALASYIEKEYPSIKPVVKVRGLGEDWETPQFEGKETLMRISDEDIREAELRKLRKGEDFRELLRSQLPDTRRVECVIYYTQDK